MTATIVLLGAAGTAGADVSGTVATPAGAPLAGATVSLLDSRGLTAAASVRTDIAGGYTVARLSRSSVAPYTVRVRSSGGCGSASQEATAGPVPDGAVVPPVVLDVEPFCRVAYTPSGQPPATGHVDAEQRRVLAGPGGRVYLQVSAPFDATALSLSLADGTVVGTADRSAVIPLTAPNAHYDGPLNLTFTYGGATGTTQIGTLRAGTAVKAAPVGGRSDLAAIVDISGSMSGADPTFRRKDAVKLLIDLADTGDRIAGIGFDNRFHSLFARTTITGAGSKTKLRRLADRRIANVGGTDYDVAFAEAHNALTADPSNPATPKSAIFLTDGAHNGTYDNTHLRFAFNATGRTWPVCVVQLGRAFSAADTARLKRIATETGGQFVKTPTNTELENLYFQCRGRTTGAKTLLRRSASFRVGQQRGYSQRVARGQRKATFFVSYGVGRYKLRLTQPGGRAFSKTTGKKVRLVRSKTFSFFEVRQPKAGRWRLNVTRLRTGGSSDRATTTITVQRRAKRK